MMTLDSQTQAIIKFFYFALLDEPKVVQESSKALQLFLKLRKKEKKKTVAQHIVQATFLIWKKIHLKKGVYPHTLANQFILGSSPDMGAWREYQKTASNEELLTVVWKLILDLPESDISNALGIEMGTVRFRLAQGTQHLGKFLEN